MPPNFKVDKDQGYRKTAGHAKKKENTQHANIEVWGCRGNPPYFEQLWGVSIGGSKCSNIYSLHGTLKPRFSSGMSAKKNLHNMPTLKYGGAGESWRLQV